VELTVELRTADGETGGTVALPAEIFDVQANMPLMHQVVVAQLAAARAGTHDTKTRGEVAGGGHKPYRQKGTGRARQGSTRAPQFAGGGVVHGPTPRNYAQRTPKKMKAAALRGALSDRARGGLLHVVSAIVDGDTPSTRTARKLIEGITGSSRVLVVVGRDDVVGWQSLRNLPTVHLLAPDQLNTYDVLVSDDIVFTRDALSTFLARTGHELKIDSAPPAKSRTEPKTEPKTEAKPKKTAAKDEPENEPENEPEVEPGASASSEEQEGDQHPFGEGSHAPLADGEQPEGFPVKGSANSKLYHVPGTSFYNRTVADVWFADEQAAEAAGFQLPPSQRKGKEDDK
jgi:large subunit ribosomal protein L4